VKLPVVLLTLLVACAGSAADHERLGDTAYANAEYTTALQEYRAAARGREARVWAKLGAVALKVGELREAVEAYGNLAGADRTRITEAARGLEMVAREAERSGTGAALEDAVAALRKLAPERVSSRHTIALLRSGRLGATEVAALGPLALAAAGDAAGVDQMLVQYGAALQGTTACAEAADVFQAALRRSRDLAVRQRSAEGLSHCGLQLGREALLLDRPEVALDWFTRVVAADRGSDRGRLALIGLGDARRALGDLLGATLAWQDAITANPTDSIAAQATARLTQVGAPPAEAPEAE
jgi:tetratricopeptide (TPR) repeat protein